MERISDDFAESLEKMVGTNHPEMKELERKIYAKALADNINNMIEEAYTGKYKEKEEDE